MARWLKQSTSVDVPIGPFLDSTDGITPETALTLTQPDVRLKKNGAAWAQKAAAQTLSHEENGFYEVTLDATDTNTLGLLRLAVFESGAAPVWEDFLVVPANVWDSFFGADRLQVHAAEITDGLITAAAIATGAIDADAVAADAVTEIAGAVWDQFTGDHETASTFGALLATFPQITDVNTAVKAGWDELLADHTVVGSFGEAVSSIQSGISGLNDITAAEVWSEAIDGATTAAESLRLQNAVLAGKASGMATTTAVFRDLADTKDRVTATVDADGNRSAVTLDAS
jgi:hypothetical protein